MKKKIIIVNNEKCSEKNGLLYCQNLEIKSMGMGLSNKYNLKFLLRKADVQPVYKIDKFDVKLSSNIFSFIKNLIFTINKEKSEYLIISVTPYTLYAFIILFILRKKVSLYLRSDGKKEISIIYGKILSIFYKVAENFMVKFSNLIVVNNLITSSKKYFLVQPSQIDEDWLTKQKAPESRKKIKLLYVGRIKVEKGIFSLIDILFKNYDKNSNFTLTIIGQGKKPEHYSSGITFLDPIADKFELINQYDDHKIVILPSFTEGYPQVLLESLARKRPIIVFEEISHVAQNFKGVFVCERNRIQLEKTIENINKNYEKILSSMNSNTIPTKKNFFKQLEEILN